MLLSPDIMRLLLLLCVLGMAIMAGLFLRERQLSLAAYLGWGLVATLLPLLGPFLVILLRPGSHRPAQISFDGKPGSRKTTK